MIKYFTSTISQALGRMKRVLLLTTAIVMVTAPILIVNETATALQITNRSVLISSAQASGTGVSYTFGFTTATTGTIQSLEFQACGTALGTCTAPTGLSFSSAAASTMTGWTAATAFTAGAGAGSCTASASIICANRTSATSETAGARTIKFTGITNQSVSAGNCSSAANCTFFIRMTTYSDTAYATAVDTGTMASATTQLLTINAAVQEQLTFCVGSTAVDNATSAMPACGSLGASLNLGTLNSANTSVSPVPSATYGGDANNGAAELSTNAVNGTTVAYDAVQQAGSGTLKVAAATCSGSVFTDQCINATGATKAAIVTGTEDFGMAVGGVNCGSVTGETCVFSTGTFGLVPTTNYNCNGIVGGSADTYDTNSGVITGTTSCSYAWDPSGTTQTIASSSVPVGNEALILKFAATPEITTPTGAYTAKADFVATPTF